MSKLVEIDVLIVGGGPGAVRSATGTPDPTATHTAALRPVLAIAVDPS